MKLYTHPLSPYAAKVRIALDEKRVAFEEVALPVGRQGLLSKPPELLAANPRGQVPVLFDGDVVLHDSTVIVEYLDEIAPEPSLLGRGAAARARARLAEDDADWLMGSAVTDLIAETFRKPDPATRDAQRIETSAAAIHAAYDQLDDALAKSAHVAGDAFGAADVAWWLTATVASLCGVAPAERHAHIVAWQARVVARPAVARTLGIMTDALAKLPN